jgi:PPOX class probable F420-dependent enzyme
MARLIPEVLTLLGARNMAHLATLMGDGAPHVSPVWITVEDGHLAIFTQEANQKARNLRRDGRVAISVTDEVNPYCSALIRGRVVGELAGEAALAIMDRMSNRYVGSDFPFRSGIAFLIEPESVRFQDLPFEHPAPRAG